MLVAHVGVSCACAQHKEEVRRVYYPIVRCVCINYQYYSEASSQPRDEAKKGMFRHPFPFLSPNKGETGPY